MFELKKSTNLFGGFKNNPYICIVIIKTQNTMASNDIKLAIGLTICKGDWDGAQWTITGNPKQSMTIKEFESAYDFEDFLKEHINCKGIEFDSEFCQFFAYAKTKSSAIAFGNRIERYFEKVRKMLD